MCSDLKVANKIVREYNLYGEWYKKVSIYLPKYFIIYFF